MEKKLSKIGDLVTYTQEIVNSCFFLVGTCVAGGHIDY